MKSKSFTELIVWKKAHEFVLEVYKLTKNFPREEIFGLSWQFRKAAVSVAANIAEGYKKRGLRDKIRFFNIAEGSLEECKYYLILSLDLGYISSNQILDCPEEIGKLINSYCRGIIRNREAGDSR